MSGQKNLVLWITFQATVITCLSNNIFFCTVSIVFWRCSNKVVCHVCLIWNSAITRRELLAYIQFMAWLPSLSEQSCLLVPVQGLWHLLSLRPFWYAEGLFCGDGSSVMQKIKLVEHSDPSDLISCESPPQVQVSLITVLIWAEKKEQMANTNLWIPFSL